MDSCVGHKYEVSASFTPLQGCGLAGCNRLLWIASAKSKNSDPQQIKSLTAPVWTASCPRGPRRMARLATSWQSPHRLFFVLPQPRVKNCFITLNSCVRIFFTFPNSVAAIKEDSTIAVHINRTKIVTFIVVIFLEYVIEIFHELFLAPQARLFVRSLHFIL